MKQMKKTIIILFLSLAGAAIGNAQEYKKFKTGLGIGYGKSVRDNYPIGIVITLEPGLRISDDLSLGLRIEGAVLMYNLDNNYAVLSFTVNGQYYLSDNSLRPFIGAGLGLYAVERSGNQLGFYPRVGFDKGHFSVSFDYNFIASSITEGANAMYSYLGIKVGAFFGGGKN
jgi:hypothetical protein